MFAVLLYNRFSRIYSTLALAFVLVGPSTVRAEDNSAQTSKTMKQFVQENPSCIDFTDGCSVCTVSQGEISCSAPRIQCQIKPLVCTKP